MDKTEPRFDDRRTSNYRNDRTFNTRRHSSDDQRIELFTFNDGLSELEVSAEEFKLR